MKKALLVSLVGLAVSASAMAAEICKDVPTRNLQIEDSGDRVLVRLNRPVCGLTNVKVDVLNDGLNIQDFKVIYGNGDVDNISLRNYFAANTGGIWKALEDRTSGRNPNLRCVTGFVVRTRADADGNNATLVLSGLQKQGPYDADRLEVMLGGVKIRDLNARWRNRGPGGRPGEPGRPGPGRSGGR